MYDPPEILTPSEGGNCAAYPGARISSHQNGFSLGMISMWLPFNLMVFPLVFKNWKTTGAEPDVNFFSSKCADTNLASSLG